MLIFVCLMIWHINDFLAKNMNFCCCANNHTTRQTNKKQERITFLLVKLFIANGLADVLVLVLVFSFVCWSSIQFIPGLKFLPVLYFFLFNSERLVWLFVWRLVNGQKRHPAFYHKDTAYVSFFCSTDLDLAWQTSNIII